jgi:metallo-beta-lactamase class B
MRSLLLAAAFLILQTTSAFTQISEEERSWNQPVEPFKIAGNIYYVGASDITSYLITTPKGHILIDSGFLETVSQIRQNVAKLGFKFEDIKILLNSHAHYDHAGGLAELKRLTKAKLLLSEADSGLMARGGKDDPNFGDRFPFEPAPVDETFRDGKTVKLGGATLTANITAGHTKGCTTWTTTASEDRRKYNVIFVCSTSAPGYKLIKNAAYHEIVSDYERTFARLKKMKVDIFLGSHGAIFGLEAKASALRTRPAANPFIDPAGYREYLQTSEANFLKLLKSQQEQKEQVIAPSLPQ